MTVTLQLSRSEAEELFCRLTRMIPPSETFGPPETVLRAIRLKLKRQIEGELIKRNPIQNKHHAQLL